MVCDSSAACDSRPPCSRLARRCPPLPLCPALPPPRPARLPRVALLRVLRVLRLDAATLGLLASSGLNSMLRAECAPARGLSARQTCVYLARAKGVSALYKPPSAIVVVMRS